MTTWPKISGFISDLDGVAYRGDAPIESAVRAFRSWHEAGIPYAFVTNNSTKTAEEFSAKLNGMGIPIGPERVVTTAAVAADRASKLLPPGSRVLVIGADSLRRSVAAKGFELADRNVAAVVAGLDRSFTFEKLALAQAALLNGAIFIGTNPDAMLPHGDGYEPGAGSILKAIETASGVAPVIIGKPQPDLLLIALSVLGTPAESTLMIGDQVDTDILAAAAAGLKSILVRTGVPQAGPFAALPDFDVESLDDIPLPSTAQEHRHG